LTLMGLAVPSEMQGHNLLEMTEQDDATGLQKD